MKLQETNNSDASAVFTAKQIIAHKMPLIESPKFERRTIRLSGKFVRTYSRNNGTYFIVNGVNYYVDNAKFKFYDKFKTL